MEPSEQEHTGSGQWAPGCRSRAKATCRVGLAHPGSTPSAQPPPTRAPHQPSHAAPSYQTPVSLPRVHKSGQTTFQEAT